LLTVGACIGLLVSGAVVGPRGETVNGEPITPIAPVEALNADKIELGRRMFHDVRLSRGERTSCATCHDLGRAGDNGRARSAGADGRLLDFNASTVFNAALNARLNWRGNFRSFEDQNEAVLLDPRLMDETWPRLLAKLRIDAEYRAIFRAIYGDGPQREHVLDALATFQRSLLTPDARFDRYLRGERDAITADETRGYQLFKAYGCVSCHQGVNIGGNLFQKFGVFHDPFAERGATDVADTAVANLGRFAITGNEADRNVFRVPSLRNVAVTSPYFHDGSVASLAAAVEIMARSQLGRDLPRQDIDVIVKFLGTLTAPIKGHPCPPAPTVTPNESIAPSCTDDHRPDAAPDLLPGSRRSARRCFARTHTRCAAGADSHRCRPAARRASGAHRAASQL
jgi:cytochrome c peroxidase